jgi:hypothetical protein
VKRILTLVGAIATLVAGVTAAVALAAGTSSPDNATGTTTTTTTPATAKGTTTGVGAGATTTTAPDTTTGTTAAAAPAATTATASSKVSVCHHTGSWKPAYHLIHISTHALPAHMRHGDVTPGANNSCPTTQPAGTKTHGRNDQSNNAKRKDDNPWKGDRTEAKD